VGSGWWVVVVVVGRAAVEQAVLGWSAFLGRTAVEQTVLVSFLRVSQDFQKGSCCARIFCGKPGKKVCKRHLCRVKAVVRQR